MDLLALFPRERRLKGFLFDNPSVMLAILVSYVLIAVKIGPAYMRDRKPYNIRAITRVFNIVQVIANVWYCYHSIGFVIRYCDSKRFSPICSPPTIDQPDLPIPGDTEKLIFISTVYFYVRIADFLDTMFFVMAKKFSHISFLHVYHHVVVVATGYVYLRSGWATSLYFITLVNSMVHIAMYSYYLLSTFPQMRPYLWWKRYLTLMQIVQFVLVCFHMFVVLVFNCGYPAIVLQFNLTQAVLFITLFSRFYVQSYNKARRASADNALDSTKKLPVTSHHGDADGSCDAANGNAASSNNSNNSNNNVNNNNNNMNNNHSIHSNGDHSRVKHNGTN